MEFTAEFTGPTHPPVIFMKPPEHQNKSSLENWEILQSMVHSSFLIQVSQYDIESNVTSLDLAARVLWLSIFGIIMNQR